MLSKTLWFFWPKADVSSTIFEGVWLSFTCEWSKIIYLALPQSCHIKMPKKPSGQSLYRNEMKLMFVGAINKKNLLFVDFFYINCSPRQKPLICCSKMKHFFIIFLKGWATTWTKYVLKDWFFILFKIK